MLDLVVRFLGWDGVRIAFLPFWSLGPHWTSRTWFSLRAIGSLWPGISLVALWPRRAGRTWFARFALWPARSHGSLGSNRAAGIAFFTLRARHTLSPLWAGFPRWSPQALFSRRTPFTAGTDRPALAFGARRPWRPGDLIDAGNLLLQSLQTDAQGAYRLPQVGKLIRLITFCFPVWRFCLLGCHRFSPAVFWRS